VIGSIIGDVAGSLYEFDNIKTEDFELFNPNPSDPTFGQKCTITDDSILSIATAAAILEKSSYESKYLEFGRNYQGYGYGGGFSRWLGNPVPYNSYGNGSAMRVGPIGWAYDSVLDILNEAEKSAECTHNHPEGIKGAQAVALTIFMGRKDYTKEDIKYRISELFGYDLNRTCDEIRPTYDFDVTCQGSVPEAIIAFLESTSYESAIKKAISLGGDSDTIACITGGIAQAFYKKIPKELVDKGLSTLPDELLNIVNEFNAEFKVEY
jgi:ADP-ribosylglycohydrolase